MAQIAVMAVMAAGALYKGQQQKKLKEAEAIGLEEAADRRMGAASLDAAEEQRKKEFMYSRALAVSAASGGGVDDAGMVALLGDLNAEGEYRIMATLWAGQNEADGLEYRAEIARREGSAAEKASYVSAVSSAVSSYAAFS